MKFSKVVVPALLCCLTLSSPMQTLAKSKVLYESPTLVSTTASKTEQYELEIEKEGYLKITVSCDSNPNFSIFSRQEGQQTYGKAFKSDAWEETSNHAFEYVTSCPVVKGNASVSITLKDDVEYHVQIQWTDTATETKYNVADEVSLIPGKTHQLNVTNYKGKNVKWVSEDKDVATVSKKGLVKAKSTGTTIVKSLLEDGTVLKTKVVVQRNQFYEDPIEVSACGYGDSKAKGYCARYDAKGNLHLYFRVANNRGLHMRHIKGTIYCDKKGKTVASSKFDFIMKIPFGSYCDFAVKINNKDVKQRVDLRNVDLLINCRFYY